MNIIKVENKSNLRRSFAGDLAKFMKMNELLSYASLVQESVARWITPVFTQIETVSRRSRFKEFGRLLHPAYNFLRAWIQFDVRILEESS